MTNSIFLTIKKLLGIAEEYHAFDIDILTSINAVFLTLNQLGIGPLLPFQLPLMLPIEESDEDFSYDAEETTDPAIATTWDDFLGDQKEYLAAVQTYVYQRVRLIFDPPSNSFLVDAIRKSCDEFEWRFTVQPKTQGAVDNVETYKTIYKEAEIDDSDFPEVPPDDPDAPFFPPDEGEDDNDGKDDNEGDNNSGAGDGDNEENPLPPFPTLPPLDGDLNGGNDEEDNKDGESNGENDESNSDNEGDSTDDETLPPFPSLPPLNDILT